MIATALAVVTAEPAGHRLAGNWQQFGACLNADPKLFFGPDHESQKAKARREAKAVAICATCPVRLRCALLAIRTNTKFGVFGGMGEDERARVRRAEQHRASEARKRAGAAA